MQCPVCNSEVSPQATFCNHCGAPLAAAAATPESAPPPPPAYTPPPAASMPPPAYAPPAATGLSDTAAGAIAYITIVPAIIFLILEPYNKRPFIRFHSMQSIALAVVWIAVWIAVTIIHAILHFIPLIGFLFFLADLAIGVAFLIAWLMCVIKASQGQWFKLPVIGGFAEQQARS